MSRSGKGTRAPRSRLAEVSRFFMRQGEVWETVRRLARNLDDEGIDYAVVGGMALVEHGYVRATADVDVLMRRESLERFRERYVGRGYAAAFPGAMKSFRDTESNVRIEVLTTGEFPGDGTPKPVAFPDPATVAIEGEEYRYLRLESLIELKLASGLSAPHRLQDLADVQNLILHLRLPRELSARLDASVRPEYERLWVIAQSVPPEERP